MSFSAALFRKIEKKVLLRDLLARAQCPQNNVQPYHLLYDTFPPLTLDLFNICQQAVKKHVEYFLSHKSSFDEETLHALMPPSLRQESYLQTHKVGIERGTHKHNGMKKTGRVASVTHSASHYTIGRAAKFAKVQ